MIVSSLDELENLRYCDLIMKKIEKIKSFLQEIECEIETIPSPLTLTEKKISINFEVTFNLP